MVSKKILRSGALSISVLVFFAVGVLVGKAMSAQDYASDGKVESTLLKQVKEIVDEKFIFWKASSTLPTPKELEYGMIKGYVDSYKDPYTVFFPPVEAKSFSQNVKGSFGGVGMTVGMKDGNIVVIAPLKDSQAMKAGIKAGDIIVAVDGKSFVGKSSDEAVNSIRGDIDTPVKISVIHSGEKNPVDITIIRKEVKIPSIDTEKKNDVFVVRLYNFSAEAPDNFRNAMNDFLKSGLKRLVIDVRGNPGGYLDAAVNIASYFLDEGKMIVLEKQGQAASVVNHRSTGIVGLPKDTKVAILVDSGSASASEILAGALQDHKIAKVVGEKSFGKGSVQELINLSDGSSIKVTIAKWFTPNGTSISEHGITPDYPVSFGTSTPKNKDGTLVDIQLNKAIEVLNQMK
jgi:carboxyl-terminal processing protease